MSTSTEFSPYARKIAAFRELLEEHNSEVESDDDKLKIDEIVGKLKTEVGGTSERALRNAKFEHLTSIGVPLMLAETACKEIFRRNGESETKKTKVLTANRVAGLSFLELFQNYDPTGETNSAVRDRLQNESGGRRCVIFYYQSTAIHTEESAKALRHLKDGMPEQESIHVDGKRVKLYRVGENPNETVSENFLYPGQMLRDGVCDVTGRRLADIPFEAQQIVYLAITETREISIDDVEAAHRVLDTLSEDAVDKAQARYGKAALMLQDLKQTGDDPKLILRKGGNSHRPNDPFNTSRHSRT